MKIIEKEKIEITERKVKVFSCGECGFESLQYGEIYYHFKDVHLEKMIKRFGDYIVIHIASEEEKKLYEKCFEYEYVMVRKSFEGAGWYGFGKSDGCSEYDDDIYDFIPIKRFIEILKDERDGHKVLAKKIDEDIKKIKEEIDNLVPNFDVVGD